MISKKDKWLFNNNTNIFDLKSVLKRLAKGNQNILIFGPIGSGKTTLVEVFVQELFTERLVYIANAQEFIFERDANTQVFEMYRSDSDYKNTSSSDFIRNSLKVNPDTIIIDEMRSPEEAEEILWQMKLGIRIIATSIIRSGSIQTALIRIQTLFGNDGVMIKEFLKNTVIITTRQESRSSYKVLIENGINYIENDQYKLNTMP